MSEYKANESPVEHDLIDVGTSSSLEKSYDMLYGATNLLKKTDLNRNEISDINIILTFAKRFGFEWLEDMIYDFLELMISKGRKGRTEAVSIAQAELVRDTAIANAYSQMENKKKRG